MSGEIVVATSLAPGVAVAGALLGAIVIGSLVYRQIEREKARRELEAEGARLLLEAELKQLEEAQHLMATAMQSASQAWSQAQQRLGQIKSQTAATALGDTAKGQGFLGHSQTLAAQTRRLDELLAIVQDLPSDPSLPGARALAGLHQNLELLRQQQSQQQVSILDLDTLEQTLHQTLADQQAQLRQEPERRAWRLQQASLMLRRLDELGALIEQPKDERLLKLRAEIHRLLGQGTPSNQDIAGLNERLDGLARTLHREMENQFIERQLRARLNHHLDALGYHHLGSQAEAERWGIPGGEQLLASVQPGMRLAFQLQHERFPGRNPTAPLDHSELALLRQQESRWCGDLKTLVQRLKDDGFMLQIDFERLIPEEAVPLVLIEDVEEILQQTQPKALRDDMY